MPSLQSHLHEKENRLHDAWARETKTTQIAVRPFFEACTSPENRWIMKQLKDISGKRVLDVGCGLGESSVYLATKGAQVVALDLSSEMVKRTELLAKEYGVKLETVVSPAEGLPFPENSFDVVYLGNIVHHVQDRETLFLNIRRVLKPGGVFVSWDPLKYNPLINVYRRIATKVRTEDESPIGISDWLLAKRIFGEFRHQEFWFLTLALFLKYYFLDRLNPNQVRYWKHILEEREENLGWFKALQGIDEKLLKIPGINLLAWNSVLICKKTGLE